ncbi:hypothetical protein AN958_10038 [Leucoagaricus sp. SymC.cos]|nr:hypothetical protein AN958_10038 [Leucoagaricus sp. SymC.cos]
MLGEILSLITLTTMLVEYNPYGIYPWKLVLVCKLWRDVVFSTPQLWINIILSRLSA